MKNIQDFIGSFDFDNRLALCDIAGSIAHVKMLAKCRIISAPESKRIVHGLESIAKDIGNGKALARAEDVHYAVEKELIKRIGPLGGKMHTARSRNDQVALDMRLYLRDEIAEVAGLLCIVQKSIIGQAEKNIDAVMPGYTHLQPAQPVLFSHHILAYGWMLERDKERLADCLKRVNVLPLGSAALAGTSFAIDRKYSAKLLNFSSVSENSIDAVSDRDFAVEYVAALSLIAMHLSRLAEELVIWSSQEFGFVRLADEFTSGSSIMPQKRNPDTCEVIRGKTGRVYGDLTALLTIMKGLPLAYNRDMQEDKPPVFDASDTVKACLQVLAELVSTMKIDSLKMLEGTKKGFLQATELADYLAKKEIPFRKAHGIVKKIVEYCICNDKTLSELSDAELNSFSDEFNGAVKGLFDCAKIADSKISYGGTSRISVQKQINELKKRLKK